MRLFTKDIDKQLFAQYPKGGDLENQKVVAKIFNPFGNGTWYLINSDPNDPDYLWAIVDLFEVEVGSVSRMDLETIKVPPFRLGLERDMSFTPINAQELFDGLLQGKRYEKGGSIADSNKEMLLNQAEGFEHHAEEFESAVKKADEIPAWVVAKSQRASTDLSDITHYLDGENEQKREMKEGEEYAKGGKVGSKIKYQGKEGKIISKKGDMYFVEVQNYHPNGDSMHIVLRDSDIEKMAQGGKIKDQYEGKTPKEIWDNLSKEQRQHFIYDHASEIENYRGEEYGELTSKEIILAYNSDFSGLDKNIRNRFENHVRQGQYKSGGEVDKHRVYFSSFAEVMDAIHDISNENGYDVVDIFPDLSYGGVSYGQTKRAKVELEWNGKEKVGKSKKREKNTMNVQIYRMDSGNYELNSYFSYAHGGMFEWQDAKIGDSALVKSENKLGVIVKDYGRKFHLKFPDGSEKTYDASELKFIKDEDEYMAKGGKISTFNPMQLVGKYFISKNTWGDITNVRILSDDNIKIEYEGSSGLLIEKSFSKEELFNMINGKKIDGNSIVNKMADGGYMEKGGATNFNYELKIQSDYPYKNIANLWLEDNSKDSIKYQLAVLLLREKKDPDEILGIKSDSQYARLLRSLEKAKGESEHEMAWRTENYTLNEAEKWARESLRDMFYVHVDTNKMAMGGVTFDDKVKAVKSSLLKRKKVSPSVQKDYGKTYSPKEAEESAKRIVGAMTARERLKLKMAKKKKK
jgi:hypothetical protein